jgi:peptidyl-prolyl cis-trans isomerase C
MEQREYGAMRPAGLKERGGYCQSSAAARAAKPLTRNTNRTLPMTHRLAFALLSALALAACEAPERQGGSAAGAQEAAREQPRDRPAAQGTRTGRILHFADLPPAGPEDASAAQVGGTSVYVSEVRREAAARGLVGEGEELDVSDPVFTEVLDELIDQRLLALEARRRGLHEDVEARRRLAAAEERILGNILVETAVSRAVTEESVERVYSRQRELVPALEEARARHILTATQDEIDEVARLLAEGQDFAALARRVSRDPASRADGGDLGWMSRDAVLPELSRAVFSTPPGEVSSPFRSQYGWHVVKVEQRRTLPRPGLDELRPGIVRFLTMEGIERLLTDIRRTYPVLRTAYAAPPLLRRPAEASGDGQDASAPESESDDGAAEASSGG